jgi:hypothetical protein
MTFEEFWADYEKRGIEYTETRRTMAVMAWDAALCSAQCASFEQGKIRSANEITATLSNLHTWVKPTTSLL